MVVKLVTGGDEPPELNDVSLMVKDLNLSGLTPDDVNARVMEHAERATTLCSSSSKGYVLPYFSQDGRIIPFYRVRLFDSDTSFKQPKDSANHIYFPKAFAQLAPLEPNYIILTEGEKSAALACKRGFSTVGLGSTGGWRNRTILVSGDAALSKTAQSKLAIKLPQGTEIQDDYDAPLAVGLLDLIDLAVEHRIHFVIIFPSASPEGPKSDDQREAFELGCELRHRGVPYELIHQYILPWNISGPTSRPAVSLSDLLTPDNQDQYDKLRKTIGETIDPTKGQSQNQSNFPQHPNIVDYVNRRLQKTKLSRKESITLALSILSDLDSHGVRLRASTTEAFYFDYRVHRLLRSAWASYTNAQTDSPFTQYLYRTYGLSSADHRLLPWLSIQFASEEPIKPVTPHRVIARPDDYADSIYYQLSDSQFIEVTAGSYSVRSNGDKNILFEADQVEPLNTQKLVEALDGQKSQPTPDCWWATTLSQVRLRDKDKQRIVAALLYYMSPWLLRWRRMQLPVELIVGESGSGKSTLCELRLEILSGRALLRNTPTDLKDWHASVTNTGGLHITDNAQLADRGFRQKLSDEICRIVTEPNPFIEQRKYYTNADLVRFPVRTVFAITSIQQPFQNADLLQRAIILELDKSVDLQEGKPSVMYDSFWKARQLARFGGREAWVAHHLNVLQRFFRLVEQKWDESYSAKNRLINFEQAILLMAEVFNIPSNWIPDFLVTSTDRSVSESDWVLEGIHAFSLEHNLPHLKTKRFPASTVSEWCETNPDYKGCEILTNTRKLGRYFRAHKSAIQHLTCIVEAGTDCNRMMYRFQGRTLERR